jgi:HTH-like domain
MATLPGESIRRVCRVLKFSRARLRARAVIAKVAPRLDEVLAGRLQRLIELYPTFGYRRLWAMLRFVEGIRVNRKAVYRLLMLKGLCEGHGEKGAKFISSSGGGSPSQGLRIMPRVTR